MYHIFCKIMRPRHNLWIALHMHLLLFSFFSVLFVFIDGKLENTNLSQFFQALTGLKAVGLHSIPKMGINFLHEADRAAAPGEGSNLLPNFSTCFNHVYLPVPCVDYDYFVNRMVWGIHGSIGGILKG